jgi:hypothetical protein
MIDQTIQSNFIINVGRPRFTSDVERQYWQKFFDYVKTVPYPIAVNGMYDKMQEMVTDGDGYLGSGFKFMFWFRSNEDRKQFVRDCRELGMRIEDWHNLTFFQIHDKTLRIRITDKYLAVANDYIKSHPELSIVIGYPYQDYDGTEKSDGGTYIVGPLPSIVAMKAHLLECWLDLPEDVV